jgi:hypothetical protein
LLIAGGEFNSINGIETNSIAAWDGSRWAPLDSGLYWPGYEWIDAVHALEVHDGLLYAGGWFSRAGDTSAASLAVWNGSQWSSLGEAPSDETSHYVFSLASIGDQLYVGGRFDSIGTIKTSNIACFDGHQWTALGSGISVCIEWPWCFDWDDDVWAFAEYNGNVMVGGDFLKAGDKISSGIAMCTKTSTTDVADETDAELPTEATLSQNYPNPFNPSTIIEYSVRARSHVTITIYNILGREVRRLVDAFKPTGEHRIVWDGSDNSGRRVSTGVYLYRIQAGDVTETKKMVLLK